MNFSSRLKKLRKNRELTQEEFGRKINKTRSTIAGYETERKEPDYETLKSIADFFDVSLDYLLGRSDIVKYEKTIESDDIINIKEFPDEAKKQIKEYIEFIKQKYNVDKSSKTNKS
ncbi:helix-turn-helix domain-containing protein [Maledivibacter halophilus]|uniref:Predicted transcriptional regulator n=1 Tax=Maledivibacter halophilus TaxID=36842 RepID=A0A1T5JDK4_9FIRM|nr:helix-turn-helix transcriptional regulator [Maledivibacter halophilus]SKC49469.1 Predicted transcriptional regulator [Maledivibacter halophilus]